MDASFLQLCLWIPLVGLALFFIAPMLAIGWRSLLQDTTQTFGWGNYAALIRTGSLWQATANSLLLGLCVTASCALLGFIAAYALERSAMPGKRWAAAALNLPLMAPSLVLSLGLLFLLGRNGLVGSWLGIRPDLYGFWGLLIANTLYGLPFAILIMRSALRHGDARLYEAAQTLGANGWQQFRDVTWPQVRYGVLSAIFVVFTMTITDFGNAAVIGGNYNVLASEIYNQVSGQMRFGMGAVVGIALLFPAVLSVLIERFARNRQGCGAESAQLPPLVPNLPRDTILGAITWACALFMLAVIVVVVVASFMKLWPYRMEPTLANYNVNMSNAWAPLWTSLNVSLLTALCGSMLVLVLVIALRHAHGRLAKVASVVSTMPVAVPGLVLGLGYVFVFNAPNTPLVALYGSLVILIACNFYHYHAQAFLMMNAAARQIPYALEDSVASLGGGVVHALRDVYIPWLRVTLASVAVFLFMMSMVTLSAIIFLVTPANMLAAVTVMRLDEAGFTTQAAAYSSCIMGIVGLCTVLMRWLQNQRTTAPHTAP
ncbi:ABC transporter permease subunit [Lampropedia puyangensis]|uniref:ABC transporter permease subunit n=2 Tax=Lampropedia puyangensis TaxID=1330072 RepID=A0A4S8F4P0_9BURK|nr:ABC transporter permease subunit [Lampropedia puyangensis]